jgi:hypothetical protein
MREFGQRQISVRSGSVCTLAVIVAIALASPAAARTKVREAAPKQPAQAQEPFGNVPKGPVQIFISINQQKLHLYSDGREVATTLVATGVPQLPTPTGVFSVIGKERFHRSNIYSGAPMPFMQRITWSGVALHEGENIGHPASHGCIRMPHDFAVKLYGFTKMGARVIVARDELKPVAFADPHLFVHKVPTPPAPAPSAAAPAPAVAAAADTAVAATKTAQTDDNKTTDAVAQPPKPETPPATDAAAAVTKTAQTDDSKATDAVAPTPAVATDEPAKSIVVTATGADELRGTVNAVAAPLEHPAETAPSPPPPAAPPSTLVETAPATKGPIAIFVSRKEKKIYVRQNFTPLFYAPITIANPEQPLGTTVFTAMNYLNDGATLGWNVVTFPGEPPKVKRVAENDRRGARRGRVVEEPPAKPVGTLPAPQAPAEVLARLDIPADVTERISALIVPGSSLVVSDQGLGDETGEGTDFIVVTRQ